MIQITHFLGPPAHLRIDQIEITAQVLILSLEVETAEAACPLCQQVSYQIHSHYTRTLAGFALRRESATAPGHDPTSLLPKRSLSYTNGDATTAAVDLSLAMAMNFPLGDQARLVLA